MFPFSTASKHPKTKGSETVFQRFSQEKVLGKYAANLQDKTHTEV